jgi:TonB family protein
MSLAHYLLQVNIYLAVFYCFYQLLLAKETYFTLNRFYLLSAGLLSLTIPFLRFEWFGKQEVARPIYIGVDQLNSLVAQVTLVDESASKFNWGNLMVLIYLLGIIVFIVRLGLQLLSVRKLFNTISKGMAYSFFRKKMIDANVPELATIDLHEEIHIKQWHTLDVLFFELLGIFVWCNPLIYCYKKTIKNIHEYLADEAAAKFQGDKETYALLLLSQAFGVRPNTLTNGFFTKSLIKKRIFMLHKQRSKKAAILKYGLFVPLFALTLVLSSATIRKNKQILAMSRTIPLDAVKFVVDQAIAEPLSMVNLAPAPSTLPLDSGIAQVVSFEKNTGSNPTVTAINADFNDFYHYIGERIKYPNAAIAKKIQGNTVINFSVRNGSITNITAQDELGEGCDTEVIDQILAYSNHFPKDGDFSLKVSFKLEGTDSEFKNPDATATIGHDALRTMVIMGSLPKVEDNAQKVYSFVVMSTPPTYPGGIAQFYKFLGSQIKYPAVAIDNEVQGNVYVSFIVEKDGSISDINVDRKLGFGTDEEAVRVLKLSKKWLPGVQNGKPVRVKYNIPIKFAFDSGKADKNISALTSIKLSTYPDKEDEPMVLVDNEDKGYAYLQNMDAKEIESVSVLKGTEAVSKYGRDAVNGIIIVKSKAAKPKTITATINSKTNK